MVEVIHALQDVLPEASIAVRTSAPRQLYERAPDGSRRRIDMFEVQCDTGMVQLDSLHIDEAASLRQAKDFHARLGEKAAAEASYLTESGATLVVGDIPPLAFAAAAKAGLPSIAIANFTWDWIYEDYAEAVDSPLVQTIRDAYASATAALRLPMAGGFAGLEPVTRDIPFIARHSRRARPAVRRWLEIPEGKTMLLMSFGGYGLAGLDTAPLAKLREYAVVTTDFPTQGPSLAPAPGLIYLSEERLYRSGYRYEDLLGASDAVVTKPGYGVISECVANGPAILYTSRGRFREYDVMVKEMPKYLRAQFISQEDLLAGRWAPALEQLLSSPPPAVKPATNGAEIAAEEILRLATSA